MRKSVPLVSLFTGGGLLDIGFEMAGFRIVWTNECNSDFADGYEAGVTAWRRSVGKKENAVISNRQPIEKVSASRLLEEAFPSGRPDLWGIIGGPPCPDFSNAGLHRGRSGDHGKLTEVFVRKVIKLRPSFFVMENVPGLLRFHPHRLFLAELRQRLERCASNYACDVTTLNALDYGVPQDRSRLFLIGFRRDMLAEDIVLSARQQINGWFQWPTAVFPNARHCYAWPRVASTNGVPKQPVGIPSDLMVNRCLLGEQPPQCLPNGDEYFVPHSDRFKTTREGDVSGKSFKRLHRWRYSPTAAYGHNEVHIHPWENRRLSVREVMRIQSVPDAYVLPANMSLQSKFKMIANGVPVDLAAAVAQSIKSYF